MTSARLSSSLTPDNGDGLPSRTVAAPHPALAGFCQPSRPRAFPFGRAQLPAGGSGYRRGFSRRNEMMQLEFTAPTAEPLTKAEIAARIPEPPKDWTRQDDVALMEGLFKLVGLMRIAVSIGKPFDAVQARFLQLRKAAVQGIGPFSLTAQSRLLEVVRENANEG